MPVVQLTKYRKLVPVEPQNFADEDARARLTTAALTAYRSLVELWQLTGLEAAALLAVSPSTWDRLKRGGATHPLNQDQLTRISALVGILKGLRLLFADDLSQRWPKMPNKGRLFESQTPVACMIDGGIPRMIEVRRHVDALRGGL
jgi:predicted secreted protein